MDSSYGLQQQLTHRQCEFRSKDHLAADGNEEIVLEEVTQASEGSAGAGLTKVNLSRRCPKYKKGPVEAAESYACSAK